MKLITSVGPNPRMVRMFMVEKGIELPLESIDIIKANASRSAEHLKKNPMGGSPVLELDNGSYLSEITVICEYLDEKFPGGNLIGANAEERGEACGPAGSISTFASRC
jgi:glutathione S-transferase